MVGIIGGSGFIGTRLVDLFLENGEEVKIIDKNKSEKYPELWEYADVRDIESLRKAMKETNSIINLAAEHKDNVTPVELYFDTNVKGATNVCKVAEEFDIKKIIFTSSVAVYGFVEKETDETGKLNPFNEYGRTKMLAEQEYKKWYEKNSSEKTLVFIRPTVVFGENNRGNVYNLLKQASKSNLIIGNGKNIKSVAYVGNVAVFIEYCHNLENGFYLFNYIDKPDYNVHDLMTMMREKMKLDPNLKKLPYSLSYFGGKCFDALGKITKKEYSISAIRVKKFCANTHFSSENIKNTDFTPSFTIEEGFERTIKYEF